jgi:tyrosine aminotransferase
MQSSSWADKKHEPAQRSNVLNPIRNILEREMKIPVGHALPHIGLGLGEPSKANGYIVDPKINEAIIEAVNAETNNGYTAASGTVAAREAIAKKFGTEEYPINPNNIFLSFGCSGALYNAMAVLCERGDRVAVAKPGFPLCQPICQNMGIEFDLYDLEPENRWNVNLESLRSVLKPNTKAILVNNPSNPCGSCWSREHMLEIIAIADEFKIPIISDEVYHGLSYDEDRPFISFGNITHNTPIICTGALSKIFCLPGWRCGWTIVYNNHGYFDKVIDNLGKHCMILLHPNSLVQAALPKILAEVGSHFFEDLKSKLKACADAAFERLSTIRGIKPIKSSAAMYMMVKIEIDEFQGIADDIDFCKKLLADQNCLTFPS